MMLGSEHFWWLGASHLIGESSFSFTETLQVSQEVSNKEDVSDRTVLMT